MFVYCACAQRRFSNVNATEDDRCGECLCGDRKERRTNLATFTCVVRNAYMPQIGNYCWVYSAHAAVFIRNTEKTCGPDAPSQCFCSWDLNQKPSGSQSRLSWCQISVVKCSGRSLLRFPSLASETNPDSSSSYSLYLL